ncbi:MAG: hypothetical protein KC474_03700 [Cyanobacteria bacterium HKST-UBA04]|nr:hypothetical protein [Cyanobacteria bacterium HKST-UBA04]MCA9841951.1 hypothetical protein [Cyanobacteria bacterium HKST-UBA03]
MKTPPSQPHKGHDTPMKPINQAHHSVKQPSASQHTEKPKHYGLALGVHTEDGPMLSYLAALDGKSHLLT